jgi:translation initiation factor 2 gamma subunit (eIF-2gamma)
MAATITRHAVTHAIIGTAGHIDHGKTALIKALTGQDTDRLKEEKERGISIDLGPTARAPAWSTSPATSVSSATCWLAHMASTWCCSRSLPMTA